MNKANAQNVGEVLRRFATFVEREPLIFRKGYAKDVNALLDALLEEDVFGTEGQLDPRGDQRDDDNEAPGYGAGV